LPVKSGKLAASAGEFFFFSMPDYRSRRIKYITSIGAMRKLVLSILLVVFLLAAAVVAKAQQPKNAYRVGYLSPRLGIDSRAQAFRQGLVDLGYVEGRNLAIEWRFVKGKADLFPQFAAELVHLNLDCILAVGVNAIGALKKLTDTIPIVMGTIDADPVQQGFVSQFGAPWREYHRLHRHRV
jgi:ABC-type uncharacterized transport system substrate-binding protein